MLAEMTHCQVVKNRAARQVFYLQAPCGEFFLKRSILIRTKDRFRHTILPRRRWAEWRNFHQLWASRIAAAYPVLRGERKGIHLEDFFVLTAKVNGSPLRCDSLTLAEKLGQYVAFLHSRGVYHADLHPENIIIKNDGSPCLIDVQEVFFFPWLPRWLRLYNLGRLWFHLRSQPHPRECMAAFLTGYNKVVKRPVTAAELVRAADRYQQRHYHSRAKRCCKNSTEFAIVKGNDLNGYKRRGFHWGPEEVKQALGKGETLKQGKVIAFEGVCIKIHHKRFLHRDRCLTSWKMSRALEVRGIPIPQSLGYFRMGQNRYFLAEFLAESQPLNQHLSSLTVERQKREALKKLASWLKNIHDHNIWQRDFKSSNILYQDGAYLMVDLDAVRICRHLPDEKKIVNLAQLNASLSNAITIKDRLRFYYYYTMGERPSRYLRRTVYRKVWTITKSRNTSLFGLDITKLRC